LTSRLIYSVSLHDPKVERYLTTHDVVLSIPTLLIHMANLTRSYTMINCSFKSLSIFAVVVAATRLAVQYDTQTHRIQYTILVFLLVIETAVAIIMASVSSYRVVVLDHIAERRNKASAPLQTKAHSTWCVGRSHQEPNELHFHQDGPSVSLLTIKPASTA
jgi:hypothetical protein